MVKLMLKVKLKRPYKAKCVDSLKASSTCSVLLYCLISTGLFLSFKTWGYCPVIFQIVFPQFGTIFPLNKTESGLFVASELDINVFYDLKPLLGKSHLLIKIDCVVCLPLWLKKNISDSKTQPKTDSP